MNLSPNMLAALRFFAGNVSEQTQTADKLLNTTVNALWRRGLLAVDTDGIIIPNEAGFAALAAVETTEQSTNQVESESLTVGQISDELWAKISPNFYAQVRAGEQASAEEARHSSMDAGIQSQGCDSAETDTVIGTEQNAVLTDFTKQTERKNGKLLTSSKTIFTPLISDSQAIINEFDGSNFQQLADKYHMDIAHVHKVIFSGDRAAYDRYLAKQHSASASSATHEQKQSTSASPPPVHNQRHIAEGINGNTRQHLGNWKKSFQKFFHIFPSKVMGQKTADSVHTNDDSESPALPVVHPTAQAQELTFASDVGNEDKHTPCPEQLSYS
jgi:hypothetical protein